MKSNKSKIIIASIGIVVGIIIIIIGATYFDYSYSGTVMRQTYGGDAYTGIQQASAQTATNTYHVFEINQLFAKLALIVTGILVILHYSSVLCDNITITKKENNKQEEKNGKEVKEKNKQNNKE